MKVVSFFAGAGGLDAEQEFQKYPKPKKPLNSMKND
jgi:hypothetical protein